MTSGKMQPVDTTKEILRVALDRKAAQVFGQMVDRLKAENPYIKVQPSAFVSFLVSDYFATYFDKDIEILVAAFFDAQAYHETQLKLAKTNGTFEQVMTETLATIKRIKSKARGQAGRGKKQTQSESQHEEI